MNPQNFFKVRKISFTMKVVGNYNPLVNIVNFLHYLLLLTRGDNMEILHIGNTGVTIVDSSWGNVVSAFRLCFYNVEIVINRPIIFVYKCL